MKKIIVLILIFLALCPRVIAQEKTSPLLRVSPILFNFSLSPGKVHNYSITVENLSDSPLPLRLSLEDFEPRDEEGGFKLDEQKTKSPLLDWVRINNQELILEPKTKRTIPFQIIIPSKVPLGGYYGILFIESLFPQSQQASTVFQTKVGVLLLANVGVQSTRKAEIIEFAFDKFIYEKGPIEMNLRVKNSSLNHFSAKPSLTLKPLFGKEEKIEIEEKFIFPGRIRKWSKTFDVSHYWQGLYRVRLAVSTGEGKQIIRDTYLVTFPITKLIYAFLSSITLAFILLRRRRIINAVKAFIKG